LGNELTLGPMAQVTCIEESMKESFVCLSHWISHESCHILQHTWYHWKALELNVLTYNEKGIQYTTTFSLKIHLNQN
jgi:hypothetical protein